MPDKEYSLKFSSRAERDLDKIYVYITDDLDALTTADNLMDNFEESLLRLKQFPSSCAYVDDEFLRQRGYRKLIVKNYIVFYIANEALKQVEVMRILYGAMDYAKYL